VIFNIGNLRGCEDALLLQWQQRLSEPTGIIQLSYITLKTCLQRIGNYLNIKFYVLISYFLIPSAHAYGERAENNSCSLTKSATPHWIQRLFWMIRYILR